MPILSPPFAFLLYLGLVALLLVVSRVLAGGSGGSAENAAVYASGEAATSGQGSPGYAPFFGSALFFAILHVGVLIAATGAVTPVGVTFVAGLLVVLLVVGVTS
jgi:NADH:ubiquinone oxidoreductase subunit 3 (subunit A)